MWNTLELTMKKDMGFNRYMVECELNKYHL